MSDNTIKQAVQELAGTHLKDEVHIFLCTVNSVDLNARTCDTTPITGNGGADIINVQLQADVDNGKLEIPAKGSTIAVITSTRNLPLMIASSELISLFYAIGSSMFLIQDGLIQFNGGKKGGLPISDNIVQRLNKIEKDINTLKQAFGSWITVPNDGGAALKVSAANWSGQQLDLTKDDDIQNDAIKM